MADNFTQLHDGLAKLDSARKNLPQGPPDEGEVFPSDEAGAIMHVGRLAASIAAACERIERDCC